MSVDYSYTDNFQFNAEIVKLVGIFRFVEGELVLVDISELCKVLKMFCSLLKNFDP